MIENCPRLLENKTEEITAGAYLLSISEIVKQCSPNFDW